MLKSKKQRKLNNKREKMLTKENNEILTDMVLYLKASDLTDYNQELIRADLIEMVIDAQERGDDIKQVFGEKYQEICDEIMEAFPRKTKTQKLVDYVQTASMCIWVLLLVTIIKGVVLKMVLKDASNSLSFSYGDIINLFLISIGACFAIEYYSKNVFRYQEKKKARSKNGNRLHGVYTYILCYIAIGLLFLVAFALDKTAVQVHMLALFAIIAVTFIVDRSCLLLQER